MKRGLFFVPVLLGLLFGGWLMAQDKSVPNRIGYIDSDVVLQAHPDFAKVKEVQTQAQGELKPLQDQLTALEAKLQGGGATAKDQQDYQALRQGYQDTLKKWQAKQDVVLNPITDEINNIVAKVAQEQGFALVMDKRVAGSSGLVVYADNGLDLTDAVVKAIPK
ncbi:MAG: OmpH family outer membrane protein [Thermaceae bacterium]|nr:OmpH family outer membrane protein [Thermaceae bacterium]